MFYPHHILHPNNFSNKVWKRKFIRVFTFFQRATIELKISEVEERGQETVADAKDRIRELEQALTDAKHAMAKQIRNYQELMNTKLALDIEISTYRKLVEGEEDR